MIKKLGELTVNKSSDYYDSIVEALKESGFIIILDSETTLERYYIVAREDDEDKGK